MLKDQHILDWDKEDRLHGITVFTLLTIQMQNLMASKEAILVTNKPAVTYVKNGKGPGRPKKTKEIAKTNSRINQFFPPAQAGVRS